MPKPSVKDQVLALLNAHKGSYYSGQELADQLGVSRTAVWKAINSLREGGYDILGTTNRGYAMAADSDVLSAQSVSALLDPDAAQFFRIECTSVLPSTNSAVRDRAMAGAAEGLVVIAEEQTDGRGRKGRSFYSPKGSGLYFSVLLRPDLPAAEAVQITAAAAVAAARAAEHAGRLDKNDVSIKWVNDLFLDGHKICGILTEAMLSIESGGLEHAVLGVGFNLCTPEDGWPEDIRHIAGSLFAGDMLPGSRANLAAEFLNAFYPLYRSLMLRPHLHEYRERQMIVGKDIEVLRPHQPARRAAALGIDDSCRLLVRFEGEDENCPPTALGSGEVRILTGKTTSTT